MNYIYIILLINNTYLIISSEDRINQIHNTPDYKDIIEIIKCNDNYEFDKIVKKYIEEFGNDKIKISTHNNNITEDDTHIFKYIDNITDIEKEIKKLTMIKQKIIHIKHIINTTKLPHIEEYGVGKFISDYAKYQRFIKLSEENRDIISQMTIQRKIQQFIQTLPTEMQTLYLYFVDINNLHNHKNNKLVKIRDLIQEIGSSYNTYIRYEINNKHLPEHFIMDTDVILQLYSTLYFNKKMNSHLTNFIKNNGTEEQLITKLTYAYSKLF